MGHGFLDLLLVLCAELAVKDVDGNETLGVFGDAPQDGDTIPSQRRVKYLLYQW